MDNFDIQIDAWIAISPIHAKKLQDQIIADILDHPETAPVPTDPNSVMAVLELLASDPDISLDAVDTYMRRHEPVSRGIFLAMVTTNANKARKSLGTVLSGTFMAIYDDLAYRPGFLTEDVKSFIVKAPIE